MAVAANDRRLERRTGGCTVDPVVTVLVLAWALGFAVAAAWLARRRDRLALAWLLFGAILGPVALVLLWFAPPGRCSHCRAPVRGWLTICEWCGMDIRHAASSSEGAAGAATSAAPRGRPLISVAPTRRPGDPPASTPPVVAPPVEAPPALEPQARSADPVEAPPAASPASGGGSVATKTTAPTSPRTRTRSTKKTKAAAAAQALASGIFVTGTVGLAPGSRYSIQIGESDLHIVGPADLSPKAVAFERALDGVDATGLEGRLVISAPGTRGGTVLVFQSLDGADASAVARTVMDAVRKAGGDAR